MKSKRREKIFLLLLTIQFTLILFGLLIEKLIRRTVILFHMNELIEILVIFLVLVLSVFLMYSVYNRVYSLLTFEPLAKGILTEPHKRSFLKLLEKVKQKKTLSRYEKAKLQFFINKSPLPKDFIAKHSNAFSLSFWQKIVITLITISLSLGLKHSKKHESNRDNKTI